MRKLKGGKKNICSMNLRWQLVDQMFFQDVSGDSDTVNLYIGYLESEFNILQMRDNLECENTQSRLKNKEARNCYLGNNDAKKKAVQLGVARGTFGLHLASYLGDQCVNHLLKNDCGVNFLTTSQATEEVNVMVSGMVKQGLKVDHTWLDQNCCCWWQRHGQTKNAIGRWMFHFVRLVMVASSFYLWAT
jgi:hypothetical protein